MHNKAYAEVSMKAHDNGNGFISPVINELV